MEENIFEGAKFGDKFVTRDGRNATYLAHSPIFDAHYLIHETENFDELIPHSYSNNGEYNQYYSELDILSRYQEPIDEDKLDELATNWNINYAIHPTMVDNEGYYIDDIVEAFKCGFRKAKER